MSILDQIASQRRKDVALDSSLRSVADLDAKAIQVEKELGPRLDLYESIRKHGGNSGDTNVMFVAAEFKRASPSKGDIATDLDVGEQVRKYANGGAGLVSVLTEPKWFKGTLDDLLAARRAVNGLVNQGMQNRPLLLRKDFIIDEYQLHEARAYGADTVLLMLSILNQEELTNLITKARALGLEPLVEVVNDEETQRALKAGAKVLGVNNRDLHTFKVDMNRTPKVVDLVRDAGEIGRVAVLSLSGIRSRMDVAAYENHGDISGILVGETLMRAPNPREMIEELIMDKAQGNVEPVRVKICGMNDVESALVAAKAKADFIGIIFAKKSVRYASVEKAKEIVQAIRAFRESDDRVKVETPPKGTSCFTGWSHTLGTACDGRGRPLVVGVFLNQPMDEVNRIAIETGIDIIQLHGNETLDDEAQCCVPCFRVVHIDKDSKSGVKEESLTQGPASAILLDTKVKGNVSGGTGETFDWNIARDVSTVKGVPVILAGGLNPENVAQAVKQASPWGVDIASGVEKSPGVKDHQKIRDFIKNAKGQ
mmetsp:Transcript_3501/g.5056  ORF Transcript_3501/g.5056 Transcript_3501/m.5056 type:complete len:539 (-) Transcript_3501:29-1645(-)|eukprot:CAMPEP_0203769264 /NCGR_PEP_ID=MMETSP0099_2-20121227/2087_1 /ASSEMBLY_ACC=CAM_ASM_000209 /TAXON_ID=96639 /ORGANISM=" , Strain NY0313808BC1" /LENGTH=538 /DNA_ID=CAMNT_0050666127 /DNA_START=133 /DNA_END=1749 /DNA_ORIENTATION=-